MAGSTPGYGMATETRSAARSGLWRDAWWRVRRNRVAIAAAVVLALLVVLALVAPWLSAYDLDQVDWSLPQLATPPGFERGHWFGTDANGRDLFVRVWYGTRVSLLVALLATLVSVLIGVAWGATAGYVGGRTDQWLM